MVGGRNALREDVVGGELAAGAGEVLERGAEAGPPPLVAVLVGQVDAVVAQGRAEIGVGRGCRIAVGTAILIPASRLNHRGALGLLAGGVRHAAPAAGSCA